MAGCHLEVSQCYSCNSQSQHGGLCLSRSSLLQKTLKKTVERTQRFSSKEVTKPIFCQQCGLYCKILWLSNSIHSLGLCYWKELFKDLGTLLIPFVFVFGLFKLQDLLVRFFFLQEKINVTDDQKPLALNNRNAFNCFNYFFFFYNAVIGITSCFLRMMISFILGTWLVSRIDRTIMQKGYERFDRGYRTWIGMIFADHCHNNPVMVCFCQLLLSHVQNIQHESNYSILNNAPSDSANCRVRKRWQLFYTLLKNPHLIPLRKHHLRANVPLKLSSSPQADIVVRAWLMCSQATTETVTEK
ncbi:hypothetical protein WMY93_005723 [Mugilogobius chulae]|uniref:Uncharacterized protein n=1 Tax=Mugilogobius chulae TaxID=88201 RepID=A0AAW0PX56_9GOBI